MKKSTVLKFLALIFCVIMTLGLLACDGGEEATTHSLTDPAEETTLAESDNGSDREGSESEVHVTEDETEDETEESSDSETEESEEVTDCGGKHAYWQTNAEGHYRDACPYCGGGAVELKEHNYEIIDGKSTCIICGFSFECGGVHELVIDSEGHGLPNCEYCGFVGYAKEMHFFFTFPDGYYCAICKYVPECGGVHSWVAGADGHSQAACDKCGAEELPPEPHDSIIEKTDGNKYSYACVKCEHVIAEKEIGSGVEAFMSAYILSNLRERRLPETREEELRPSTYYSMGGQVFDIDGTVPYFSFTLGAQNPTTAQWLWIRNDPVATQGSTGHEKYSLDIGDAKYMVMKVRTNNPAQKILLNFSTEGKDDRSSVYIPLSVTENSTWGTYIFDLGAVFGEYYAKAEGASSYKIDDFYFHITPFSTDTYLDFAYIAFVSGGWQELDGLIDEDIAVIVKSKTSNAFVNVKDGTCIEHSADVGIDNGEYVSKCSVCNTVFRRYGVMADSASAFMPETAFEPIGSTGCTVKAEVMTDKDGTSYTRYNDFVGTKINAASPWSGSDIIGAINPQKAGRYMAIKLRVGENGLGQNMLRMYISTVNTSIKDESQGLGIKVTEDGQWHTIVIDLAERVGYMKNGEHLTSYTASDDGTYTIKFLQLRLFHGAQYGTNEDGTKYSMPEADDYMDIANIVFFDSLDDISSVISSDTYELSVTQGTSVLYNKDGTPVK